MDHDFDRLIDDGLRALWRRDPVTATFAGERAGDALLPRADADAEADECRELDRLSERVEAIAIPDSAAARIDTRHLAAYATFARSAAARRARYRNPAWYTGEATFGLIALLLADEDGESADALEARLRAIPPFLDAGIERLHEARIPVAWAQRARVELRALERLTRDALTLHPAGRQLRATDIAAVHAAARRYSAAVDATHDGDAACGTAAFALILERVHGLRETPAALERRAADAFTTQVAKLERQARRLDPSRGWREQIAQLAEIGPDGGDIVAPYRYWHERAVADSRPLIAATDYGLRFAPLPPWAQAVAADLYFLFYRAPAAYAPGAGSTYWVTPTHGTADELRRAHNTAAVKLVHAVHHGSIGHHTQNARARSAPSRFARIAGTDAAAGIALLAGGTMVEGWACYAEDLMADVPDFYTPAERLQLAYFELRAIAGALADLRFHTGTYTLDQMQAFYRDDVAFAARRIAAETTRNSIFPGTRVMYWCGSSQIKALRRASSLPASSFHETLLNFGSTPIAWIAEELAR